MPTKPFRFRRKRRTKPFRFKKKLTAAKQAKSNKNQITKLKKAIETKMCDQIQGVAANTFAGQFNDAIVVDAAGQEQTAAIPFCPSLLRIPQGIESFQRIGDWITMKSLTMKYCITADRAAGTFQRVYLMLVLDNDPTVVTSLSDVLVLSTAAGPPPNKYALAYQNLNKTGLGGRYKILWKKTHNLSSQLMPAYNVPATTQVAAGGTMQPSYNAFGINSRQNPARVYGSITIKSPYKLNYPTVGGTVSPQNKTIRLYAWSESLITPGGAVATLQYYCRFRFKDA